MILNIHCMLTITPMWQSSVTDSFIGKFNKDEHIHLSTIDEHRHVSIKINTDTYSLNDDHRHMDMK